MLAGEVRVEGCERLRRGASRELHSPEDDPRGDRLTAAGVSADEAAIERLCRCMVAGATRLVGALEELRGMFAELLHQRRSVRADVGRVRERRLRRGRRRRRRSRRRLRRRDVRQARDGNPRRRRGCFGAGGGWSGAADGATTTGALAGRGSGTSSCVASHVNATAAAIAPAPIPADHVLPASALGSRETGAGETGTAAASVAWTRRSSRPLLFAFARASRAYSESRSSSAVGFGSRSIIAYAPFLDRQRSPIGGDPSDAAPARSCVAALHAPAGGGSAPCSPGRRSPRRSR